ncbi:hypothetical protein HYR69_11050 [Candidatus Sumerlaeota bacterium]|nr:hypothetical protein [Candidatus Sumerlaeota bacterium]MBI3735266.1 hypothetical protein [Candidatus Sumerlaeota bacterium]
MKLTFGKFAPFLTLGFYTPKGLLLRAGILLLLFAAGHLAGWREGASLISGTLPEGDRGNTLAIAEGIYYILSYFAAVLAAPILILAAGIMAVIGSVLSSAKSSPTAFEIGVENPGP